MPSCARVVMVRDRIARSVIASSTRPAEGSAAKVVKVAKVANANKVATPACNDPVGREDFMVRLLELWSAAPAEMRSWGQIGGK